MAVREPFYGVFAEYGEPDFLPSILAGIKTPPTTLYPVLLSPISPIASDSEDSSADDDDAYFGIVRAAKQTRYPFELPTRHPLISPGRDSISPSSLGPSMVKKRSSLSSIFAPAFLHPSSSSSKPPTRMRSSSSGSDYPYASSALDDISHYATLPRGFPPPDLIDDDPFANLSALQPTRVSPVSPPRRASANPRSPLSPRFGDLSALSPPPATPTPAPVQLTRTASSSRMHGLPAHQKPAFRPRPSLPSLHTLAKMNLILPKKVRKGKVGAGLPFEPWNDEPVASGSGTSSVDDHGSILEDSDFCASPASLLSVQSQLPSPPTLDTEAPNDDFLDFSEDEGDHPFHASPLDEDIDTGLDYYSSGSNLELPDDVPPSPALSRNHSSDLGHSYSSSTSSTSSIESLGDEIFTSFNKMRGYSLSPDRREDDDSDTLPSPPDDLTPSSFHTRGDSWGCTPTPPTSMYVGADPDIVEAEPGTSVDTITLRSLQSHRRSSIMSAYDWLAHRAVDADDWEQRGRGSTRRGDLGGWAPSGNGNGGGEKRSGNGASHGGRWNGGNGDDDGRGDKPRRAIPAFAPGEDTTSSDESDSADEYGQPSATRPEETTSDDDDIPLAQRIPTALKAQRTIRLQEKDRRERRERRKAEKERIARSRQDTLRPAGAAAPAPQIVSSSQEAALHASKSIRRPRTQTVSGTNSRMPFAVEDLSQRLHQVKVASLEPPIPPYRPQAHERMRSASPEGAAKPTLRPMRSFHRPERRVIDEHRPMPPAPMPVDAEQRVRRSNTRAKSRVREESATSSPPAPVPALPRRSEDRVAAKPRPSMDQAQGVVSKGVVTQQRIFIGDRQRFNIVEVGASTNAGDVLEMLVAQGSFKGWQGSGGWMLFEVAQDFGMERPIRNFELLSDVESSWNKDKTVNLFVAKITPLAQVLRRSAIPSSSPVYAGYVEWEIKRGKWGKRWMSLREHSIFLSKRDNGKDETLLCSLSNFDAYTVTQLHKAPKPCVFSIKSTDNISFFENTADYLHIFSCNQTEADTWMEKILLARSYVLHQERNVLFNPKASGGNGAGSALTRTPTRKATAHHAHTHAPAPETLVDVRPPELFAPGSLLRK